MTTKKEIFLHGYQSDRLPKWKSVKNSCEDFEVKILHHDGDIDLNYNASINFDVRNSGINAANNHRVG